MIRKNWLCSSVLCRFVHGINLILFLAKNRRIVLNLRRKSFEAESSFISKIFYSRSKPIGKSFLNISRRSLVVRKCV